MMKKKDSMVIKGNIFVKLPIKRLPDLVPSPCDGAIFLKLVRVVL